MPAQTRLLEFLVSLLHGSLVCPILCVTRLMKLSVTWALPVLTAPSPCKAPHGAFPVFCTGAVQQGWSATKILIFAVPGYIFTSFPLTVHHLHRHCTLDMACSSLSAHSCPVLALDWGLQPFHSIIPELEHLHRHCYLFFACTCLQTLQWQCLPQSIWLALYSGHFSMQEDFLLPQNFLFICSCFPAFFYAFVPAQHLVYFYTASPLFTLCHLTILEHSCHLWQGYF